MSAEEKSVTSTPLSVACRTVHSGARPDLTAPRLGCRPEPAAAAGAEAYAVARHELRLAVLLDQAMRGYAAQVASDGGALTAHPRVVPRDRGMAETVFWLMDRFGPDVKIIVAAANSHIPRIPLRTRTVPLSATGHHLATRLGSDYLAVGMTCTGGRTAARRADAARPGGVAIVGTDLAAPEEGSIESALSGKLCVLDLRPARAAGVSGGPDRIRVLDTYQRAAVLDAYDLMINIPEVTPTSQVSEP
jgi:erythromycin esterase